MTNDNNAAQTSVKSDKKSVSSQLSDIQSGLTKYIPIPVVTVYTAIDAVLRTQTVTFGLTVWWWIIFGICLIFSFAFAFKFTQGSPVKMTTFSEILENARLDASVQKNLNDQLILSVRRWEETFASQKSRRGWVAFFAFLAFGAAIGGPFTTLSLLIPGFVWEGYFGAGILGVVTLFILYILDKEEL
jgi:hypothetical protein